jgi:CRISPR-associated protein Cmr2
VIYDFFAGFPDKSLKCDEWTQIMGEYASAIQKRDKDKERSLSKKTIQCIPSKVFERNYSLFSSFDIEKTPDISALPLYSFMIHFKFKLAKPYLSHDDKVFYPNEENSLRKEKVFKLPMISPSSWKGNLRAALRVELADNDPAMVRLFGSSKQEEAGSLHSGRLVIYPSFFKRLGREVINPHDRVTKAGRKERAPIFFEVVPVDSGESNFTLIYIPCLYIDGRETKDLKMEVKEDLFLVAKGLREMLLNYGFSAKKTSGYGAAKNDIRDGIVVLKRPDDNNKPLQKEVVFCQLSQLPDQAKELVEGW